MMQGYYKDPEQTSAAFHEGWFKTGDLVRRGADGNYTFVARKKDIIRRRGENIAGAEIDRIIAMHAAVAEVAAIGVSAEIGEEEILVAIVPKSGASLSAEEVRQWCGAHLAEFKVPRYVAFVESMPHTPTHKIAKHVLRQDPTLLERAVDLQDRQKA
jgi:crotonobetaine/carnitine-CoA ligase